MNKLIVCIMGQNCERFLPMCLDSVKTADAIIYCDGGSTDNSITLAYDKGAEIIMNEYDQKDIGMNGKQRNYYLQYLKDNYMGEWVLCLDADEIVEDLNKVREVIHSPVKADIIDLGMRHLIGDLAHEDFTVHAHYVLHRLFKISDDLYYPEVEHPVLQSTVEKETIATQYGMIWHLAYIPAMWEIKKRYDNHMKKSNIHTPQFLKSWYYAHLFGKYPKKEFDPIELPQQVFDAFGIEKDEIYFANRGLEHKHWIDAVHWRDFFKPKEAIEFGCGRGPRVYALNNIGVPTKGIEISKWAVDNSFIPNSILKGDVTENYLEDPFDLVIAYDLLEHIEEHQLDYAINNLIRNSNKYILISVPVIGDPNLMNDKTHKIFQEKSWWVKQFTKKGLKQIEVPQHFQYRDQLMIFEVKNES